MRRFEEETEMPVEDVPMDGLEDAEGEAELMALEDVLEFTRGKEAEDLRGRYMPPEPSVDESEPIPGVEASEEDAASGIPDMEDLTPEQLEALRSLLSE